jgi:siroheme decarboxylase
MRMPEASIMDPLERALLHEIENGLPLVSRPYREIAQRIGSSEAWVTDTLQRLVREGIIKRVGVVVRHRELGYHANAMVVWDVPDADVAGIGRRFGDASYVTLCYRRPRRPPDWPYNLFTMIHGRDRGHVLAQVDRLISLAPEFGTGSMRSCSVPDGSSNAVRATPGASGSRAGIHAGSGFHSRVDMMLALSPVARDFINRFQGGFPLSVRPYRTVAAALELDEASLIAVIRSLLSGNWLSRFGPVYDASRIGGAQTLAALEVPSDRYEEVTGIVNDFDEVAHNYRREHRLNMWFVLATEETRRIGEILARIEERTALPVYDFPKLREFYLGLWHLGD